MQAPRTILILLVSAALAGCLADDGGQAATASPGEDVPVGEASGAGGQPAPQPAKQSRAQETSAPAAKQTGDGRLEGYVIDDEELPIKGVLVTLLETGAKVRTNEGGAYAFTDLVRNQFYTLTFEHELHETAGRQAQVPSVGNGRLDVVLPRLVFDTPYFETLIFEGHMLVGNAWTDIDDGCATTGGDCRTSWQAGPGLETIVTEIDWTPNTGLNPLGDKLYGQLGRAGEFFLYLDGNFPAGWSGYHVSGDWPAEGEAQYQTTVCDITWMCPDQRYTHFVSLFYFEPAPAGWTYKDLM